ncbi:MAG: insulinase family protein [Bacteroidetes bacterium]|nr:insulinase family protein [Bacteroidota bacterium]
MRTARRNLPSDTQQPSGRSSTLLKSALSSGLRVITEHVPSAHSLALGVWIDTGSRDEASGENGISHFIEHCVFKGTKRRRTHHIAQYLESVGGYLNAFTTKDNTCYYARVLQPHLDRAVHLLADIVLHSTFPEREVEKEKQVIIEEMRGAEDDPEDLVHDQFEQQLFGKHALGQPIIGEEPQVLSFSSATLHEFVRRHYVAENMVIAAAGAVDHDVLLALCEKEFADIPHGTMQRRRKPQPRPARHITAERPIQQAHLVLGTAAAGYHDGKRHALAVLNAVLGEGMSSRLFQRVRERHGYAYNIYSFVSMFTDVSTFGVYAAIEPGRVDRARDVILHELALLQRELVPARELNRAKEQIIGSMMLGLESMTNRMTRLGRDELVYGRDIPVSDMIAQIRAVSAEDIRQLAAVLLAENALSSRTLLPSA